MGEETKKELSKEVTIKTAKNGYIVMYFDDGFKEFVFKNVKEATDFTLLVLDQK